MNGDRELAAAFDDPDVADAYTYRPPYPDVLIDALVRLPERHHRALDLGCGTGKISHALAPYFNHVDAVDPSRSMLDVARNGHYPNISWIHDRAESVPLAAQYDLVTAGASIHWMDHAIVFPRIASVLAPGGVLAVIEGDDVDAAIWKDEWLRFIQRWLSQLGKQYDPAGFQQSMDAYLKWMTVSDRQTFQTTVIQEIDHFIACQHSRATWSRRTMGDSQSKEFDVELRHLLQPYTCRGTIKYSMQTQLTWGVPKLMVEQPSG